MLLLLLSPLLVGATAEQQCTRTGSSPKCEPPCCGDFPSDFTMRTRACQPPHDKYPFCDPSRSLADRVGDLIARIPDEAKPHLLTVRPHPHRHPTLPPPHAAWR